MGPDQPPRRPSLRSESPAKDVQNAADATSKDAALDVVQILKTRRHRAPRTYARKRPRAKSSAQLDTRSATVSLETRNCGEGRISLGTRAVPLPVLAGGGAEEDSFDAESSSDDDSDTQSSRKRRAVRKRRGPATTNRSGEADDERSKLNEFLAQQKAFWDEVDDSSLVEEEEGD